MRKVEEKEKEPKEFEDDGNVLNLIAKALLERRAAIKTGFVFFLFFVFLFLFYILFLWYFYYYFLRKKSSLMNVNLFSRFVCLFSPTDGGDGEDDEGWDDDGFDF